MDTQKIMKNQELMPLNSLWWVWVNGFLFFRIIFSDGWVDACCRFESVWWISHEISRSGPHPLATDLLVPTLRMRFCVADNISTSRLSNFNLQQAANPRDSGTMLTIHASVEPFRHLWSLSELNSLLSKSDKNSTLARILALWFFRKYLILTSVCFLKSFGRRLSLPIHNKCCLHQEK